jgi:exosortase/archaeosortase family protein
MFLLFLLIPSGDVLQPLLRALTVKWVEWFALSVGLPISVEGYVVHVAGQRYVVIDACSGLTFVTLAGFLGYCFGLLLFRSLTKVLGLALLGAVIGIATNAVRVNLIVGIDWLRGTQMDLAAHQDIQWIVLLVSLGLLIYLATRLEHDESDTAVGLSPGSIEMVKAERFAPVVVGVIFLVGVGSTNLLDSGAGQRLGQVTLQRLADLYPAGQWLSEDDDRSRALELPMTDDVDMVLVEGLSGTGRLNEGVLDPEDREIWRHADTRNHQECSDQGCVIFVHRVWKRKADSDSRHVYYAYHVGAMTTESKLFFRLANGLNRLRRDPLVSGLIAFKVSNELPGSFSLATAYDTARGQLSGAAQPKLDFLTEGSVR